MALHRIVSLVVGGMVGMHMLALAQLPCDEPYIENLVYRIDDPAVYPPLSIYMPYDVLLGYVALDSLHRAPRPQGQEQALALLQRQQTLTDTTRKILRVYYAMADYDPILLRSAIMYMRGGSNSPWIISSEIRKTLIPTIWKDTLQKQRLYRALFTSSYILHVRVLDTMELHSTYTSIIVSAEVLDVLKGQVLVPCGDEGPTKRVFLPLRNAFSQSTVSNDHVQCILFSYSPNWFRFVGGNDIDVADLNESEVLGRILVPGTEAIVMLDFNIACWSDSSVFYYLTPIDINNRPSERTSCGHGIYPIVEGIVQDPMDDFGFGTNLSAEQFKLRLRERIAAIRNW
ncbi:MAG: hypothetical protein KatS3mg040_1737 [Candidatus Kapaibacterium sp.]|jgi:hypothetical protein|nr:MAG: hypothetical protein KatS3mg040_1737 [Candidatus Kapabacteria bacterium]